MSLRRAFRIAGAETVLASHWKVSDKATSQLMTEFMRRWRAGEPREGVARSAVVLVAFKGFFKSILLVGLHLDRAMGLKGSVFSGSRATARQRQRAVKP